MDTTLEKAVLRFGTGIDTIVIKTLLLLLFFFISTAVFSQYLPFHSIYVTDKIDSLETMMRNEKEPYRKLKTLLSIEKSHDFLTHKTPSSHLVLLDSLCRLFPEMKGHLFYFRAKYEALKFNDPLTFEWSQKAYKVYTFRKDTTGMIGALKLMGTATINSQPKQSSLYKYGQKYLMDAYTLSNKIKNSEAKLLGINAYVLASGIDFPSSSNIHWEKQGINSTPQNRQVQNNLSQSNLSELNKLPNPSTSSTAKAELKSFYHSTVAYKIDAKGVRSEISPLILDSLLQLSGVKGQPNVITLQSSAVKVHSSGVKGQPNAVKLQPEDFKLHSSVIKLQPEEIKKVEKLAVNLLHQISKGNVKARTYSLDVFPFNSKKVPLELVLDLAMNYRKNHNYSLSIELCQFALAYPEIRIPKKRSVLMAVMETYRLALKGLKRYEEMAVWSDSIYFYAEKYRKMESDDKISELVLKYETLEKEKQKKILEQQIKIAKLNEQFYFIIGALGLFCLIGLGVFLSRLSYKNSRLQKAMGEIQTLNKTKDFFMGIIVHDLRRPLSSLQEMAELVDFYLKGKRYEELKKVSLSIDRSGANIRQLLDNTLHWVISQEGSYQPEEVNIAAKIKEVLELYAQLILKQQIKLVVFCPSSLTVFADRNGLAIILRNLIDNALKHLGAHGELTINVFQMTPGKIQIEVKDNGKGMEEKKLTEIRYILTHADELIPGQKGHSLGMLLIGRFIKINQGSIEVESQVGEGTAVTITLLASDERIIEKVQIDQKKPALAKNMFWS